MEITVSNAIDYGVYEEQYSILGGQRRRSESNRPIDPEVDDGDSF